MSSLDQAFIKIFSARNDSDQTVETSPLDHPENRTDKESVNESVTLADRRLDNENKPELSVISGTSKQSEHQPIIPFSDRNTISDSFSDNDEENEDDEGYQVISFHDEGRHWRRDNPQRSGNSTSSRNRSGNNSPSQRGYSGPSRLFQGKCTRPNAGTDSSEDSGFTSSNDGITAELAATEIGLKLFRAEDDLVWQETVFPWQSVAGPEPDTICIAEYFSDSMERSTSADFEETEETEIADESEESAESNESVDLDEPTLSEQEETDELEEEAEPVSVEYPAAESKPTESGSGTSEFEQMISSLSQESATGQTALDALLSESQNRPEGMLSRTCRKILKKATSGIIATGDVLYEAIQAEHKVVAFKGISDRCGCTTLLLGAACELAGRGLDILVIDGNFEHPCLSAQLNLHPATGWEEALFRKINPKDLAYTVQLPPSEKDRHFPEGTRRSFQLLPLAPSTVSKAIVASCKREWMDRVLDLAGSFDLLLVDTGSFGPDSIDETAVEMLRFGVDGYLLIEDLRRKSYSFVAELVEETSRYQLPCLGIIANFT